MGDVWSGNGCWLVEMRNVKQCEARDGPWRAWRCHRGRSTELKFRRYASHSKVMDFSPKHQEILLMLSYQAHTT